MFGFCLVANIAYSFGPANQTRQNFYLYTRVVAAVANKTYDPVQTNLLLVCPRPAVSGMFPIKDGTLRLTSSCQSDQRSMNLCC